MPNRVSVIFFAILLVGCVQRQMNVVSDPPGAVVYLNDREMGRTPFKKTFLWYGNYDVVLRKDGYKTLKTNAQIDAPIWQWIPLDAVTDFLPLTDEHTVQFKLTPDSPSDANQLVQKAEQLQQDLESSQYTIHKSALAVPPATTQSTTQPSK